METWAGHQSMLVTQHLVSCQMYVPRQSFIVIVEKCQECLYSEKEHLGNCHLSVSDCAASVFEHSVPELKNTTWFVSKKQKKTSPGADCMQTKVTTPKIAQISNEHGSHHYIRKLFTGLCW